MSSTRWCGVALVASLVLAACGGDDSSSDTSAAPPVDTSSPTSVATTDPPLLTTGDGPEADGIIEVPGEASSIQLAVDVASPGDLILISPGIYVEAVDVITDELTIRGLDRALVVLDGGFELDNGIRVLGASGVTVQNLTVQNYAANGVFWTGVTGYHGSYITSYRNGDYGIYAFDSVEGQIDNSYASGSAGAGIYVGQCFPCDGLVDSVHGEWNGLGYQGTNSGGNLAVVNSTFNDNRVGIFPNSGSYELCYPQRRTDFVGNLVYDNNQPDSPSLTFSTQYMGNGILVPGGIDNVIARNRVVDHDRTGIGLIPFVEPFPNDDLPTEDEWTIDCATAREEPLPDAIPDGLLWDPFDNVVADNVVSDSAEGDLAVAALDVSVEELRNCWSENSFETSRPADLETLAPCAGSGSGDWNADPLDVEAWEAEASSLPPGVPYEDAPLPPIPTDLPNMPDAASAPAAPAVDLPEEIDLAAIEVPAAPDP